jgi:periplasmic nitrate reductase NapD
MSDVHIASCVAFARPDAVQGIAKAIEATRLAEVPRQDGERGRLVILIEAASASKVLDVMDAIRALDGVLAVHLAYQHAESETDMKEAP